MKDIKLVVIGGGSSYTPELAEGIIKRYECLPVKELVLADVKMGEEKVTVIRELLKRMFERAGLKVNVTSTLDRESALPGSDFVVTQFRVGGLKARAKDESIPLRYGVIGQETTGPGGFAKALRTIPVILDICRDIERLCPDAWLINFTNPSGIVTEAVHKYSKVKCVGLCNVPINMERAVIKSLHADPSRVYCSFMGLNHLSYIKNVYLDGMDITPNMLDSPAVKDEIVKNIQGAEWAGDFLTSLGLVPSPYLKYFYFGKQMLEEEQENVKKGLGTRADEVMRVEEELFQLYRDPNLKEKPEQLSKRGGALYSEAAVSLIDSIFNNRSKIHVVNTKNNGAIADLPEGSVIETNCVINSSGAHPISCGHLSAAVRGLVQQVKAYEELTIEAAVKGDRKTALMALINNPLVPDAGTAQVLLDEILNAHREYLSNFFKEDRQPCI
jgi:6-phospho-beta-glucosidase